jgi:small-conductance mechanosensitive channel
MHLQDGPDLDLSAQVAKVREKTRPWKAIIALVLAIAAAVASLWAHSHFGGFFEAKNVQYQIIAAACAAAFCVFGSIATIGLAGKARWVLERRAGTGHAAIVRYFILLIGGFTVLVITLSLFHVPVTQLVLGGALTSVFVGIAAQQALGNVFAGMVLLLARPFRVGDTILLRAGALGGELAGTVTDIGITYVRLDTGDSVVSIPNSQVLNSVVGPEPKPGPESQPAASDMDGAAAKTPVRSESPVPSESRAAPGDDRMPPGTPRPPGEPG